MRDALLKRSTLSLRFLDLRKICTKVVNNLGVRYSRNGFGYRFLLCSLR
jgi:hypothetical protein